MSAKHMLSILNKDGALLRLGQKVRIKDGLKGILIREAGVGPVGSKNKLRLRNIISQQPLDLAEISRPSTIIPNPFRQRSTHTLLKFDRLRP